MYGTPPPSNETWSAPATDPEALNICELFATNPKFKFIGGPYEYVLKVKPIRLSGCKALEWRLYNCFKLYVLGVHYFWQGALLVHFLFVLGWAALFGLRIAVGYLVLLESLDLTGLDSATFLIWTLGLEGAVVETLPSYSILMTVDPENSWRFRRSLCRIFCLSKIGRSLGDSRRLRIFADDKVGPKNVWWRN